MLLTGSVLAAAPVVEVRRDGDTYVVHASAVVDAAPHVAWETLTDHVSMTRWLRRHLELAEIARRQRVATER